MELVLPIIAEYTIKPVGRQLGYVIHCRTNLQKLDAEVQELKAARQATNDKVAEAERKGEKIKPDVLLWLKKVGEIIAHTDKLLNDESQAKLKCLYGFCPNLIVRHQLSRKSTKLVQEVVEHSGKRELISQVSCGILRTEVWAVTAEDYQAFQSRTSIVEKIMDHLKDSKIQRMAVCGMGGVGKTSLVKEVYKQASEDENLFDDVVILLDVEKDPNLEGIQKRIVEKLGMDILENETIEGRASRLCARVQGKKIFVILDDVKKKIDLEVVGLPRLPTCKILFTCRTREALSFDMHVNKVFHLDVLDQKETWSLFEKMAGGIVERNGDIRKVAMQVAERCGGLPLLVVTVASALKEKNKLQAWKDALRRLKGFDKHEFTEKAYLALEWSYDQLDDKELKPLLLLCGVIVCQNHIYLEDLLKYGLGLRLFKNVNTVEEARDALDTLLEKLKDSCLLLDSDTEGYVRMHDIVCHVAKGIAYRDEHVLSVEYGGELREWPKKDFLKKCTKIYLTLSNIPTLSEIPLECPELEMIHLRSGKSVEIPSTFFREMQSLKVMDLANMCMTSLPSSLQYLKKLQTLCLEGCILGDITLLGQLSDLEFLSFFGSKLKNLPTEIGQLTRLRLLDLSNCFDLEEISPTVISRLVRLEDLKMRNSFNKWEVEGGKSNVCLSELKHLSQLSALEIHIPNANVLPANLFSHNKLERFNIYIGDAWEKAGMTAMTINALKLKLTKSIKELDEGLKFLLKSCKDLSLDETEVVIVNQLNTEDFENLKHLQLQNSFTDIINRKVVFPNLATLRMHRCDNLRLLFSFSMARSLTQLTHLNVSACELMQEIVSSTRECGEENMDVMFPNLKVLNLEKLPNLTRFSTGKYIEFPVLEELDIEDCYNLGAFIGDKVAMSSKGTRICKEIEQSFSKEEENLDIKSETSVQYVLFDEKVGFPSLMRLDIRGIRELKAIWHVQLAQDSFGRLREVEVQRCDNLINLFPPSVMGRLNALETLQIRNCNSLEVVFELLRSNDKETHVNTSFPHDRLKPLYCQNLDSISIYKCNSLKKIFPASVASDLQELTWLSVDSCYGIEEIVGEEEEEVLETPPQFVFPKITYMLLRNLRQLRSFYPGMHALHWPLLETVKVLECDKVGIFAAEISIFRKKHEMDPRMSQQPFFLADKDSFLNLELLELTTMEIWNGAPPAELVFGKLKTIWFRGNCSPFSKQASVLFLERLQNLEKIEVRWSSSEEIFVNEGISSSEEIHAVGGGILPHVRILKLFEMEKLMHLGNENSQSAAAAGPVLFPKLEILEVERCARLRTLESSAISFRNLTTLTVCDCNGLEYLTTDSVAKSFMQLTTMQVKRCQRIVVIVASNRDDDADAGNEIAFSRLKYLELADLLSLQGFYSANCIIKCSSSMILKVENCPIKLKISPNEVLLTEKQCEDEQRGDDDDNEQKTDVETARRSPEILSEGPDSKLPAENKTPYVKIFADLNLVQEMHAKMPPQSLGTSS